MTAASWRRTPPRERAEIGAEGAEGPARGAASSTSASSSPWIAPDRDPARQAWRILVPSPPMNRNLARSALLASSLALSLAALAGCDDSKSTTSTSAKPSATAPPVALPPASAALQTSPPTLAPTASAASSAASPPPKKKDVVCTKEPVVTISDPTLEGAVRAQLQKKDGPIQRAELKKVKTLNLSQASTNNELDPCIFPEFTGVKGLYLAPGKLDDISPLKTLTQIESLRLSATAIKDLTPLAGMVKLDRLDLGRTPVSDLKPLAALVNL